MIKYQIILPINKRSRQFLILIRYGFIIYQKNKLYIKLITISMSKVFLFLKILPLI